MRERSLLVTRKRWN